MLQGICTPKVRQSIPHSHLSIFLDRVRHSVKKPLVFEDLRQKFPTYNLIDLRKVLEKNQKKRSSKFLKLLYISYHFSNQLNIIFEIYSYKVFILRQNIYRFFHYSELTLNITFRAWILLKIWPQNINKTFEMAPKTCPFSMVGCRRRSLRNLIKLPWNYCMIAESNRYFRTSSCTILIQNEFLKWFFSTIRRQVVKYLMRYWYTQGMTPIAKSEISIPISIWKDILDSITIVAPRTAIFWAIF